MRNPKILIFLLGIVYLFFVYFLLTGNTLYAIIFGTSFYPIIALFYLFNVKKKPLFFTLFLVFFSTSELLLIIFSIVGYEYINKMFDYFLGNTLYILAYSFLVLDISKNLSFKKLLKDYKITMVVLVVLSIYVSYKLLEIVKPSLLDYQYSVEIIYNLVMLLVLSMALLNYSNKNSKKAFYLLIGALCIVFSEVMNIAFMYVSSQKLLRFFNVTLLLIEGWFFYQQSLLNYKKTKSLYDDESL